MMKKLNITFLDPVYVKKTCPRWKGYLPTRVTLSEPTSPIFPYITWKQNFDSARGVLESPSCANFSR